MATSLFYVLICLLVLVVTKLPFEVETRHLAHPKPHYSNFLTDLEGLSKGQTAKGIPELRHYLKRFGYLNNGYSRDDNNEELYDEVLESAVKLYQTFFKLNVTGKLDSETIKVMSKSRCGVADNPVQVLSKRKLEEVAVDGTQQHNFINIGEDYAFFPGKPKWPYTLIRYRVDSGIQYPEGINEAQFKTALEIAAIVYSENCVLTIEEALVGHPPDVRTGFYRGDHGDGYPFAASTLGHAFSPTDGRMHFNADQRFSINDPIGPDQFDLVWTVIHEFGHIFGLDHTQDKNAIMYPTADPGVMRRYLSEDDILAMTTLYPWPPF